MSARTLVSEQPHWRDSIQADRSPGCQHRQVFLMVQRVVAASTSPTELLGHNPCVASIELVVGAASEAQPACPSCTT